MHGGPALPSPPAHGVVSGTLQKACFEMVLPFSRGDEHRNRVSYFLCVALCLHAPDGIHTYIIMYVCMFIHTYIHTYIHKYTHCKHGSLCSIIMVIERWEDVWMSPVSVRSHGGHLQFLAHFPCECICWWASAGSRKPGSSLQTHSHSLQNPGSLLSQCLTTTGTPHTHLDLYSSLRYNTLLYMGVMQGVEGWNH